MTDKTAKAPTKKAASKTTASKGTSKPAAKKAAPGKKPITPPSANKVDVSKLISAVSQDIKENPPLNVPKMKEPEKLIKRPSIAIQDKAYEEQKPGSDTDLAPTNVEMPKTAAQLRTPAPPSKPVKRPGGRVSMEDVIKASNEKPKSDVTFPFKFRT